MKFLCFLANFCVAILLTIELCNCQNYFQQQSDYVIEAQLDTASRTLIVECNITYTNNSDQLLDTIPFHLWWNSVGSKQSDFAIASLNEGHRAFHFAGEEAMGFYTDLEISNENNFRLEYEALNPSSSSLPEIILVALKASLLPGESCSIQFNYRLRIPNAFSRFGYNKGYYKMTQWFPKPAVFDNKGWHKMNYLKGGEFYSEFGSYEVTLHLPRNMNLGHTGKLKKIIDTDIGRQHVIEAENVHDFAWFASEDYVSEIDFILIDGHEIRVEVLHKGKEIAWINAMSFAKESLHYYSEEVGPYPYSCMTVVQGNDSDLSAMEYPMITIINGAKDEEQLAHLINHEIGHNWFYGLLASNERMYTWMDEGFTAFFDHKYHINKFGNPPYNNEIPDLIHWKDTEYSFANHLIVNLHQSNRDVAIAKASQHTNMINYFAANYEQMVMCLNYLEAFLGKDIFTACVQTYFNDWKFKHPGPEDLQDSFESISGEDLDWFFEGLINSKERFDYAISKAKHENNKWHVEIQNKASLEIPFQVSSYDKSGNHLQSLWSEPIAKGTSINVALDDDKVYRISINGEIPFLDFNRSNNHIRPGKLLPKNNPLAMKFGMHFNDSREYRVSYSPMLNYNVYDGLIPSVLLTNNVFPLKRFRWFVNAGYGLSSNRVTGFFALESDIAHGRGNFRKMTFGFGGRRYDFFDSSLRDFQLGYWKVVPMLKVHFSRGIFNNSSLTYRAHIYNQEYAMFHSAEEIQILNNLSVLHQLSWNFENRKRLVRNKSEVKLEYEDYAKKIFSEEGRYLKLSVVHEKSIFISPESKFKFRFFGSWFLYNSDRESSNFSDDFVRSSIALSSQGFTDYGYENFYFARSRQDGFFSRQIDRQHGGFKNAFGSSNTIGMSNDFMLAINLESQLPWGFLAKSGLKPYLDMALVSTKGVSRDPLKKQFLYSAGLAWQLDDFIEFYLPLLHSEEIRQAYSGSSLLSRISFKINFSNLNLWADADNPATLVD